MTFLWGIGIELRVKWFDVPKCNTGTKKRVEGRMELRSVYLFNASLGKKLQSMINSGNICQ